MKIELDRSLCERYPKIFRDRYADMQTTAMCWGFDCGDGWYDLLDHLCNQIQWYLDRNAPKDTPQVVAEQVKEKYGTLRFYVRGGDEVTNAYITFAEGFSGKICEICGNPGKSNDNGWIRTLCKEHNED